MANEKPEIELSKLTPEQVKKLEGELTGLIGGAHSMSSERIATMVTQGHSSHLDETSARPTAPAAPDRRRPPAPHRRADPISARLIGQGSCRSLRTE